MSVQSITNIQNTLSVLSLPGGSSVVYNGDPAALGVGNPVIANFPSILFADFLIMSTGNVTDLTGANTAGDQGTDLGASGANGDKATLTFTIPVPKSANGTLAQGIGFDFTFLSEEFPEYVGSEFNDYFSVKIDGVEVARDPSGKPITVNNNFFSGKYTPTGSFFDGQTPPLHIQAKLPAGAASVQVTLEIADVGDGVYDSAVFLNNLTFVSGQTVFIDFDGGTETIGHGAAKGQTVTLPGLAPTVATAAYMKSVVDILNDTVYKDFNITFTATRPTAGEYATILVGGAGAKAAVPRDFYLGKSAAYSLPGFTGLAEQVDVNNRDLSDLAIILTENFGTVAPTATSLAQTIGHETGHLLGLYHVNDAGQIMYYAKNDALLIGGSAALREFPGKSQDSVLELSRSLGLKSGSTIADPSKSAAETLTKQSVLGFGTEQIPLYDAQIAVLSDDGPAVFVELGRIAPNSFKKFAAPLDGASAIMFFAKSTENGAYDVFSKGVAGQTGSDPLSFKYGADTAKLNFDLVRVNGNSITAPIASVSAQVDSKPIYIAPLSVTDLNAKPASETLGALVDFDGFKLGGVGSWKIKAQADVQGDGDKEIILFNQSIGRWATLGPDSSGIIDLVNHSWGGDTRVVGIYIDPLVQSGEVVKGSAFDSQARFTNDLMIDNIAGVLDAQDYDGDGFQEVYFSLTDKTAVLRAVMHADGNIQYANYQSASQLAAYLTSHGYTTDYFADWIV